MNHVEGGWPKDVKTEMIEHKNKFIRKTLKEDMFKYGLHFLVQLVSNLARYTTTKLGKVVENVLKQNNTLDLEEMYFEVVCFASNYD